jgi:ribosome maturation factor RimP
MIEKATIQTLLEQYLTDNNIELVDIKVNKANNIKIYFDTPGRLTTIEDCAQMSRYIESRLDRDKEDFSLTVSSSGKEKA